MKKILTIIKSHPWEAVIIGLFVGYLYFMYTPLPDCTGDTEEYLIASETILHGKIDTVRPPVYPLILAFVRHFMPYNFLKIVTLLQIGLFVYCGAILIKCAKILNLSRPIRILLLAAYLFNTTLMIYQCHIITESFSTSVSIIFIYTLTKWYYQQETWLNIGYVCAALLFLLFIRPSFLYLLVIITAITLFLLIKHDYKRGVQMATCLIISVGLMLGYCKVIESKTGIFTPSTVIIRNDVKIAMHIGLFTPDNITNPIIKQRAIQYDLYGDKTKPWSIPDFSNIPMKDVYNELTKIKNKDRLSWYRSILERNIKTSFMYPAIYFGMYKISSFHICFYGVYLMLVLTGIVFLSRIKRFPFSFITVVLWLMCMGNLAVNLLGSYMEWMRLFAPSIPMFLLLLAQFGNLICAQFWTLTKKIGNLT